MQIPAAENMGLRETAAGVLIPLDAHVNDKGCLFAGSLFAGATLAAYRAAERLFAARGLRGELVAKGATIEYLKRVESDGLATAEPQGEPARKPNGNHTLTVTAAVADAAGAIGAAFSATFVLLAPRGA